MGKYEAKNNGHWIASVKARQYVYGVLIAAAVPAVFYGLLSDTEAGIWITFIGTVLGLSNGLALANTDNSKGGNNA